jgi:hypothetical protein
MTSSKQTMSKSRWLVLGAVTAFIAGMATLVVLNLPRGFDMDLAKVGAGKPAVVFVYDNNLSVSGVQTGEMDKIRDRFGDGVHFLVADTGRPQARQWMAQYQARPADLFFFDAQGELRHRQPALLMADELAGTIREVLETER